MFVPGQFQFVVSSIADVPANALIPHGKFGVIAVPQQVAERVGGSVSDMFPELARDFPKTVKSMESYWSKPKLAITDMGRGWLATLFLEQEALNLFLDDPHPIYADEAYFDVSMMPLRWVGLYRSMSSFCITDRSTYSPLGWSNTPLPRSMDIDQFSTQTDTKMAKLKAFEKQLGVSQERKLRCWMITDGGDSLWIDEQHGDKKVHHVHADAFADAHVLRNPDSMLDHYMAHVLEGGAPKEFEFRLSY